MEVLAVPESWDGRADNPKAACSALISSLCRWLRALAGLGLLCSSARVKGTLWVSGSLYAAF